MPEVSTRLELRGIGIGNGRAMGRLKFLRREVLSPRKSVTRSLSPTEEWKRMEAALLQTETRIRRLYERARQSLGEEEAQIFEIHGMLLQDEDFTDALRERIGMGHSAEDALEEASKATADMLSALDDPYLRARAADIADISAQILQALLGEVRQKEDTKDDRPYLLVADDLSPSETVMLEKSMILGFVTFRGTSNSHTAILARAMGIPALVSVGSIDASYHGSPALLDAADGTLIIHPTEEESALFLEKQSRDDRIAREHDRYLRTLMNKPAVTRSGHRMLIYANIGDAEEVAAARANGADGIGLLRSEFLYLKSADYPTEETLYRAYRSIAEQMEGKRTVIRTLDVGADKRIPYFGLPEEENPALGFRAIRICLAREDIFKTQLRAILRASAHGRLSLMLPMVVSVDEVRRARRLLEECRQELQNEKLAFDPEMEFGIMIETPAAAIMSEELAAEVDFFSVGTNDLTQYTLAADRQNPALDRLCEENTEPVLRLIARAADAIHRKGGWIGICGEMAADLRLTQHFADLRIDELSVSVPYLLGVRGRVTECR